MGISDLQDLLGSYLVMDAALILFTLLSWWLLNRFVFKRLKPLPAQFRRPLAAKFGGGVVWGLACLLAVVLVIWAGGGYAASPQWIAFRYPAGGGMESAVLLWSFFAAQSLFEELLFRAVGVGLLALLLFRITGILFTPEDALARQLFTHRLWFYSGLAANVAVAVAFAAVHAQNPHFTLLAQLNIALAGLVLGQLYWLQGSAWGAWGWHWIWNAGIASLGLPVSGVMLTPALLGIGVSGSRAGIWSGGAFGPEGSLACSLVLAGYFYWLLRLTARGMQVRANAPEVPPSDSAAPASPPEGSH